jgi:hypothetical protein
MMAVPALRAVTTPVAATVATDEAALLQTPPETLAVNVMALPAQAVVLPVITPATGAAKTFITTNVETAPQAPVSA